MLSELGFCNALMEKVNLETKPTNQEFESQKLLYRENKWEQI